MTYKTTLLSTNFVTPDVKRYTVAKPDGFNFIPGQWTKLSLDIDEFKEQRRPFTFTSKPEDKVLEFTIKSYHDRNGVTHALWNAKPGDSINISEPRGSIKYSEPGIFIAAGTGITPFLSIFRDLWNKNELVNNTLIYSNKTKADIICENELTHYFNQNSNKAIFTLTRETIPGYKNTRITKELIEDLAESNIHHAYVCGPTSFTTDMLSILDSLKIPKDTITFD